MDVVTLDYIEITRSMIIYKEIRWGKRREDKIRYVKII